MKHTLLAMEFGAEDGTVRATFTEELLRYGQQKLREGWHPPETGTEEAETPAEEKSPESAEALIRLVLGNL